ncbi:MAG: putative pyridoxal phosphate-dependent enzyme apparently involved in regulation of cell wall [Chthonomonadales bacterium]|nr:putative pyridoxal phosphate-dependent enzyme apparently involved in regulation of cell wall [Chthonomonadales bacterium]
MKVPLADLRAQYHELKEEIDTAIRDVIESSHFIGGEKVAQLERDIAALCGANHGIGVASGTDALTLSLVACGIGPGDEVITTPFTFGATSEAIALAGATPVYVDIDACTYNIVEQRIEEKITPRTRAILPVDLYGQMCDREILSALAQKHNLCLIIDAAQAVGARQNGHPIGVHANMTTLSFYPTKNLGAYGDGGMILTNNDAQAELLRSLRGHGTQGHKYHHVRVGYCSRLDAIQAVVLQAKLPHLEAWNAGRRRNAELYHTLLADISDTHTEGIQLPSHDPANYHIYHQYTVRHPRRDAFQAYLKANGVDSEIYYPIPTHLQPAYAYLGYKEGDFPAAERVAREVLSLPIHPELTEEQIVYVADLIRRFPA